MSEMSFDETLEHFGVRGMKWGVRKDRGPGWVATTTVNSSKKRRTAAAAVRVGRATGKAANSPTGKKVIVATAAATAVVGAAVVARHLSSDGHVPVKDLAAGISKIKTTTKFGSSEYGREAVSAFTQHVWDIPITELKR